MALERNEKGKLPGFTGFGCYTLLYLADDGETFCAKCANGENGSDASESADPGSGWLIVAQFVHWEGPPELCAHCGEECPSEYGDPEKEEQ